MITVNLLPFELRPIKRSPLPYILSAAFLIGVIAFILLAYMAKTVEISKTLDEYNDHVRELEDLADTVAEYNALIDKKDRLAIQVQTIKEIASDRIVWSRQLYNLSRLALSNLWYTSLRVISKPFQETVLVYNPQTEQNENQIVSRPRLVLVVDGYIVPGPDGQSETTPMLEAFEADEEFSNMFSLQPITFLDTEYLGTRVRKFTVEYVIDPAGALK